MLRKLLIAGIVLSSVTLLAQNPPPPPSARRLRIATVSQPDLIVPLSIVVSFPPDAPNPYPVTTAPLTVQFLTRGTFDRTAVTFTCTGDLNPCSPANGSVVGDLVNGVINLSLGCTLVGGTPTINTIVVTAEDGLTSAQYTRRVACISEDSGNGTPPSGAIDAVSSPTTSSTYHLTGTATDDLSGVKKVTVTCPSCTPVQYAALLASPGALSTTWAVDLNLPVGSTGNITALIEDNAANVFTTSSTSITRTLPLLTTTTSMGVCREGTSFSLQLSHNGGGSGAGYTWSKVSGTYPTNASPAFSLTAGGLLTATPTAGASGECSTASPCSFVFRVTDSLAATADTPTLSLACVASGSETAHTFFEEMLTHTSCAVNPDVANCLKASHSMRTTLADLDSITDKSQPNKIYSSTAANPAVFQTTRPLNIVSVTATTPAIIALTGQHNFSKGDSAEGFLNGATGIANGRYLFKRCEPTDGDGTQCNEQQEWQTKLTLWTTAGAAVSGTAGTSGLVDIVRDHQLTTDMLVGITGHSGLSPAGSGTLNLYVVASTPTFDTFTLKTIGGSNVASTGGAGGTSLGYYWELFKTGEPRTSDPYGPNMDAVKITIPKFNSQLPGNIKHSVGIPGGTTRNAMFIWDWFPTVTWRTGTLDASQMGDMKQFQFAADAFSFEQKLYFNGRRTKIVSVNSATNTITFDSSTGHPFSVGDKFDVVGWPVASFNTRWTVQSLSGDYDVVTSEDITGAMVDGQKCGSSCYAENPKDIARFGPRVYRTDGLASSIGLFDVNPAYGLNSFTGGDIKGWKNGSLPIRYGVWNRFHVLMTPRVRGDQWAAWAAGTGISHPLRQQTGVTCSVTSTIATCTTPTEHKYGKNDLVFFNGAVLDGDFVVTGAPSTTTFTIDVPAGTANETNATTIGYLTKFTVWISDEERDPIKVFEGPMEYDAFREYGKQFWWEFASSAATGFYNNDLISYARNFIALMNVTPDGTILRRPVR